MDSPEDSKIIADRLAKERHQMPQVPMAYKNGRQWHSRTRPEPAYLAHRPRRLPNQHGAVGDGLPLPQKSVSAARSARQEPEKDWTPYKLKASPHLADFFSSDDGHVATTLAELVASSDPEEEPMSEISAPVITPSTSDEDPDPDSKGPTKVSQETEFLYIRDWKSALSYKHGPLTEIKLCRCFLHDCISSTKQPHEMARQDRGKEHKSRAMSNTSIVVYYL